MSSDELKSGRSTLRRLPYRGYYDRETIYSILDRSYLCHIGYVLDDVPVVIPTAYGREGNWVYVHGSVKSGMMQALASGSQACLTVMQVDGIVLARSLFHSSMNYHSVILFGRPEVITETQEKINGLKIVSESIWPGRWDEARRPSAGELKATEVLRFHIADGSAKIRTGGPVDNAEDYQLDIWAGVIPVTSGYGEPLPDEKLDAGIKMPPSVSRIISS